MRTLSLTILIALMICSTADARRWRRCRGSSCTKTTYSVKTSAVQKSAVQFSGNPSQVAAQKAEYMARHGYTGHVGGSFGGCRYEGTGWSTRSAQEALDMCCYTGERVCVGWAVRHGPFGWRAVKLFK